METKEGFCVRGWSCLSLWAGLSTPDTVLLEALRQARGAPAWLSDHSIGGMEGVMALSPFFRPPWGGLPPDWPWHPRLSAPPQDFQRLPECHHACLPCAAGTRPSCCLLSGLRPQLSLFPGSDPPKGPRLF